MENIKNTIEALLFVSEGPLTKDAIKRALFDVEMDEIRQAINELREDYETRGGGFSLKEVAGGYQLRTRPDYNEYIKRLLQPKPLRMSKAALETLAIIAYKQPVIRADVEHIRGVDSGGILRMLLDRKLIRILGRRTIPGRPLIYGTTKLFLEVFDLRDLKELPSPKEIEALEDEANGPNRIKEEYIIDPNQRQLFESEESPEIEDFDGVEPPGISDDVHLEDKDADTDPESFYDMEGMDIERSDDTDLAEAEENGHDYPEGAGDFELDDENDWDDDLDDIDAEENEGFMSDSDEYDDASGIKSDGDNSDEDEDEEDLGL